LAVVDGVVNIAVVSGETTSIVVSSPEPLTPNELNAINASVTTTEVGGDSVSATDGTDYDNVIDGGEGLDTLVFEGDMNIDMGALDGQVTNIEALDLGEGQQEISLSLDDVMDVTDADNLLRIDGDAEDTINLDTLDTGGTGEWTLGEFKTDLETGQTYQQVTGGEGDNAVTLEISTNITIEES
ncbi:MAG: hypothetical protein PHC74_10905, partial [Sulfurimonas sp.]|nr:hypothetical protein [Sulfurimonas sp.]